jgi:ornithine cyclodeaminase/alanine dehydrogenase-like protein (mu-crystallin family)
LDRRSFLKTTGAGLAGLAALNVLPALAQGSPNERIRHAVIGTGGMGKNHCRGFSGLKDCEVVAVWRRRNNLKPVRDRRPKRNEFRVPLVAVSPRCGSPRSPRLCVCLPSKQRPS